MDGEYQRQAVEPGGRRPYREDGEVFSKVDVYHIGSCGQDQGDDRRLGSVELAKTSDGQPQAYHAGVVAEALEIRRGRRTRGHDRLDDPTTVERPGKLGSVVLHPAYGIELDAPADQCRGGRLEHRAEPQYPDPRLLSAPHLLRVSRSTPCGARSTAAPFYPRWVSPGRRGECVIWTRRFEIDHRPKRHLRRRCRSVTWDRRRLVLRVAAGRGVPPQFLRKQFHRGKLGGRNNAPRHPALQCISF